MENCPVCNREIDISYGENICSICNSKFEFHSDRKIVLIKRNKFDYWTFFLAISFPLIFFTIMSVAAIQGIFDRVFCIPFGLAMIFHPILIIIRQIFHQGLDSITLIDLYISFFRNELKKEDIGRKIGFYLTFITNMTGVVMILIKLII